MCLVPTISQHHFGQVVTRLAKETVDQIASGVQVQAGVFPVLPPEGVAIVLPDLDPTPLEDVVLALQVFEIQTNLIRECNKLCFAHSRLDSQMPAEAQLMRQYEQEAASTSLRLLEQLSQLQVQAQQNKVGPGQQEWEYFWEQSTHIIQQLANFKSESEEFSLQTAVPDALLWNLFAQYLNRKYRGIAV